MTAFQEDTETVVGEAAVAVGTALDEFHFSMESFGDAVVFAKTPHSDDERKAFTERISKRSPDVV